MVPRPPPPEPVVKTTKGEDQAHIAQPVDILGDEKRDEPYRPILPPRKPKVEVPKATAATAAKSGPQEPRGSVGKEKRASWHEDGGESWREDVGVWLAGTMRERE